MRRYLTCWIALDDVSEANGTVYLLPYERAGTRDVVVHVRDEETNDMIGYFGDDAGDPVVVPAGSIACFSSTVFHRSGPNTTEQHPSRLRRPVLRRAALRRGGIGTAPPRRPTPHQRRSAEPA